MNSNHCIIGLGGTGGKIIRSFRKAVFQQSRGTTSRNVNLAYLYVDSSDEMMGVEDPSWKMLGTSVQLDKRGQLLIQEANLRSRLDNIDSFPGIKPWIGDPEQWRDVLGSIVGVTLGGQKRRLGRFLFACKAEQYRQQVQTLVKDLQQAGTTEVTFHVLCGLAGGTGSGSVIDALAILRDTYPDSKRYRILLYALLPETYPNPNWDTGNYHANGFAALLELNALSTGRLQPTDLTGVKGRLRVDDPFNGCYLFTNENANGLTVDVNDKVPEILAAFLYQKIVAAQEVSWPALGRFENAENGDGTPERAPGSNNPERSKRFLTFGIKRLAVPEQEISEYLTYNFARQAALQLRFNTWSDTSGYIDEPKNADFHEAVQQNENLLRWNLTDDHLMLSIGILQEDIKNPKWKPIANEWQDVLPNLKSVVRAKPREQWLDELAKLCERRYDQDYRGVGVRRFYEAKYKARNDHAKEVRRRVETELFEEWRTGEKSTSDVSRLLSALSEALDERRVNLESKFNQAKADEDQAATRVRLNNAQWASMGFIQKSLGKPDSLLDAQAEALQSQYIARTRSEAYTFARQLLEIVKAELTDLKAQVDAAANTAAVALKKYNEQLAALVNDDNKRDLREQLVRFYDAPLVRSVTATLVRDQAEQKTQTQQVRQALVDRLGDHPSFTVFNQRIGITEFRDIVEKESAVNAQKAHNTLIVNDKEKLLGVSIVERLKERYGGDPQELRTFITDLVAQAGNYLTLDPAEQHKSGPGIPAGAQTAVSTLSVIMPKRPEREEFTTRLKEAFQGAGTGSVDMIDTEAKPNEIALISLTNLFPLRYVKQVAFLKEKYEQRLRGSNGARARLELHLEGDGSQYPRLFVPQQDEMKRDALPYLLLAKAVGLIREETQAQSGATHLLFVAKDEAGFDTDPIELGKTLIDALGRIDLEHADQIRGFVTPILRAEYADEVSRANLQRAVVAEVDNIKSLRGGSVSDETYAQFRDAGRLAVKLIRPEN